MITLLALPAVTAERQDTSVGVLVDSAKLLEWLSKVRRHLRPSFKFSWAEEPRATVFRHQGEFAALLGHDGIYIEVRLCNREHYREMWYPIDEFCRMMQPKLERSRGWCVTVNVTVQ